MVSDVLTGLAQQIQSKYGVGETQKNAYNVVQNGTAQNPQQLGDFTKLFSQNTQPKYLEEGYLRLDPFNVEPKTFELLMQEPNATVLIKKRAFSTLAENYRSDVMDQEEKLYLKATKILFQNKCNQIQSFEKLTKIYQVSSALGYLDDALMPLIIQLVDNSFNNFAGFSPTGTPAQTNNPQNVGGGTASAFQQLSTTINQVRQIVAFSATSAYTSWITRPTDIFQTIFAQGTGVIELTSMTDVSTTTTLDLSGGNFNITISDPYGLMRITESDIEYAISDAFNFVANQKLFQLGQDSLQDIAANNLQDLNSARASRGVGTIQLISNTNSILGNLITAIITNSGQQINYSYNAASGLKALTSASAGVTVSKEALIGSELGNNGLNPSEVNLFATAVISQYAALNYVNASQSSIFGDPSARTSLSTNAIRKKLRLHYMNKMIAQPMDRVHIYLSSKTRTDDKLMTGISNMFSGLGYLQNLDQSVYSFTDQFNTLFNPSANIDLQLEKSAFVGSNFPNGLWALMRNTFVGDKEGAHVFGGVVTGANQDMVPGKFTVNITGKDNTYFFDLGVVNINPGVDNFAGPLYDPLTPFKTSTDTVTTNFKDQNPTFLPENQAILANQTFDKGLIKFKSGRYTGQPITASNFFQDSQITKDNQMRNVYHGADGLIYKWKEGMGTFTYNADSYSAQDPERIGIPAITNNPFAGQDIMNTLSLLITGTPYNYATYFKAVSEFDNTSRDPQTGQDPATSFYNALSTTLQKNNILWGDFIPYKAMVMDPASYQAQIVKQLTISNQNNVINTQLQTVQDLKNQLYTLQSNSGFLGSNTGLSSESRTLIAGLQAQLVAANATLNDQLVTAQGQLQMTVPTSIQGNDPSVAPSVSSSNSSNISNPTVAQEQRRLTNFLTRRLSWEVRANQDKNLLIIDDSYDKDYDILAFEKSLQGSIQQFNTEFLKIRDKINLVANLLSLEVFCDTQGHIRIRPQQYNRMPSSVFNRMMQLKYLNNIQIFPNFLANLYVDQVNSLTQSLEVLEQQIRLDGALLGESSDTNLSNYIGNGFQFFSNNPTGDITDVSQIIAQSNPDSDAQNQLQTFTTNVQNQQTASFSSILRARTAQGLLSAGNSTPPTIVATSTANYISQLTQSIFQKSGQQITLDSFTVTSADGIPQPANSPQLVDVVKVTQDLSDKVNQRQQLIKSLASVLQNAQEWKSLDASPTDTANKLLFPNLYGNQQIPAVFAHMIEQEDFDDYGPGSGSRYIIHNYQIIHFNISENPPEFTMLEVTGQIDPFISNNSLPFNGAGNAFPQGGNAIITAAAVDYDLWRMYGFRNTSSVAVPFLSQPETQCAPYAVSLLSRNRKEIIKGSVTIAGNEFMQPGEVVYIEEVGLLFYIHSVQHSFSFGSQKFTTTLELTYGHNPGEYIPTPLDIIGKGLYNQRDISGFVNYRQTNLNNETAYGAIVSYIPPSGVSTSNDDSTSTQPSPSTVLTTGTYGQYNIDVINNLLYGVAGIVTTNNAAGSNVSVIVELRIFYDKTAGGSVDATNASVRSQLQSILTGGSFIPTSTLSNNAGQLHLPAANVSLVDVDISSKTENRTPSKLACDQARNISNSYASNNNYFQEAMFLYVVDCVLTFNNIDTSTNNTTGSTVSNG